MKQNYKVYFSIFGKKMVTAIEAESESEAREKVRDKIVFYKIVSEQKEFMNSIPDDFFETFGIKRKK